jgi:hypothetical protein
MPDFMDKDLDAGFTDADPETDHNNKDPRKWTRTKTKTCTQKIEELGKDEDPENRKKITLQLLYAAH